MSIVLSFMNNTRLITKITFNKFKGNFIWYQNINNFLDYVTSELFYDLTHNITTGVPLATKKFGVCLPNGVMVRDVCCEHYKLEFKYIPTLYSIYKEKYSHFKFNEFLEFINFDKIMNYNPKSQYEYDSCNYNK